ncbi:hypothetical protein BH20CHL6_BH20CHL6_03720 [soil metagenome]|jgi:hypothetical protein
MAYRARVIDHQLDSFADVIRGGSVSCPDPGITLGDLAQRVAIGGWPAHLSLDASQAQRAMKGYLHDICYVDVEKIQSLASSRS